MPGTGTSGLVFLLAHSVPPTPGVLQVGEKNSRTRTQLKLFDRLNIFNYLLLSCLLFPQVSIDKDPENFPRAA
mgnify:FL=1